MSQELGSARVVGSTLKNNHDLVISRVSTGLWEIYFDGVTFGVDELQVQVTADAGEDPPGDPVSAGYRVFGNGGDPDDARVHVCTWKNGALADVGFSVIVNREV